MSVWLRDLESLAGVRSRMGDVRVDGVHHDSREVEPGDLFVALTGQTVDGRAFAPKAIERGAVAVCTTTPIDGLSVPQLLVDDAHRALPHLADRVLGEPTKSLRVIGITGTNGKTTTSWIVDEALALLGKKPSLLGTVESRGPGFRERSSFTTPEGDALARFARRAVDAGADHLVMEVSSHALALHRADAMRFEVAAFTNLTQDHLDFHGTMEAYFQAKLRLFRELAPRVSIVRIDDAWGARLAGDTTGAIRLSRETHGNADVHPKSSHFSRQGLRAECVTPWGPLSLESPMLGAHNLDNLLVAASILASLGHTLSDVERALSEVRGAPGRLARVDDPRGVAVLIDYAHTPDALEKALLALRPITPGRLIAVFGCGGDRDRQKRPMMGAIAARVADLAIITSDNPRTEVPEAIIAEIEAGAQASGRPRIDRRELATRDAGVTTLVDRRAAITAAIEAARAGDTVLIAGKGHEDYQIIGTTKTHFDDREEAIRAIRAASTTPLGDGL